MDLDNTAYWIGKKCYDANWCPDTSSPYNGCFITEVKAQDGNGRRVVFQKQGYYHYVANSYDTSFFVHVLSLNEMT